VSELPHGLGELAPQRGFTPGHSCLLTAFWPHAKKALLTRCPPLCSFSSFFLRNPLDSYLRMHLYFFNWCREEPSSQSSPLTFLLESWANWLRAQFYTFLPPFLLRPKRASRLSPHYSSLAGATFFFSSRRQLDDRVFLAPSDVFLLLFPATPYHGRVYNLFPVVHVTSRHNRMHHTPIQTPE